MSFAPVGAVMGHLALSQIKHLGQRGRDRALTGLTLSYAFILFVIVALIVWELTDYGDERPAVAPSPPRHPYAGRPLSGASGRPVHGDPADGAGSE